MTALPGLVRRRPAKAVSIRTPQRRPRVAERPPARILAPKAARRVSGWRAREHEWRGRWRRKSNDLEPVFGVRLLHSPHRRSFLMTLRYVLGGVTTVVIGCGLSIGVAFAQQRDGGLLPLDQSGEVTVTGCLMRGDQLRAGDSDKFALARPRAGSVASVPERTCSADADATAVHLDNPEKGDITEAMLGRWIEIHGRLEKETSSHDNLRELDVLSARLIPVEAPRVAAAPAPEPAAPAPAPAPAPEPEPAPIPVATSGQAAPELPTTASYGPLAGLIGLFACAGGIVLRSLRSRQRG